MDAKFDRCDDFISPLTPHHTDGDEHCDSCPSCCSDMLKRDRFELLNAYLDSEVTADERRQVEDWLANDPIAQKLYFRLLKLRQGMKTMPVPQPIPQSVNRQVESIINRSDRRLQVMIAWGSTAVAALFIGLLSSVVPGDRGFMPQIVESPVEQLDNTTTSKAVSPPAFPREDVLVIALDKPVVTIPKAPISLPEHTFREMLPIPDNN